MGAGLMGTGAFFRLTWKTIFSKRGIDLRGGSVVWDIANGLRCNVGGRRARESEYGWEKKRRRKEEKKKRKREEEKQKIKNKKGGNNNNNSSNRCWWTVIIRA